MNNSRVEVEFNKLRDDLEGEETHNCIWGGQYMKNKKLTVILSVMIAISMVVGLSLATNAGNVSNTPYQFHNTNSSGNTTGRGKLDSTKTYIHPTSGPALTYTVQGYNGSVWNNRSSSHTIYNGTQASFTNFVYENGESTARVHMERTVYADTWTEGDWSPDSSQNYTIYY